MQKPDIQDNRSVPAIPRINIIVSSDRAHVIDSVEKQDYPNKNILLSNENPVEFFNRCINKLRTEPPALIICLDNKNWFNRPDTLSTVFKHYHGTAGIYTDIVLQGPGYGYREYLPPFSAVNILKGLHPFNRPFFMNSGALPNNPMQNVEHMYLTLLAGLCQSHYIPHLPEALMAGSNE